MKFITLYLILLIGILTCYGHVCPEKNEYTRIKYGEKVKVNGKKMAFSVVGNNNDIPIVLLPGLNLISPILSFKPFAEALSKQFKVITLEPFGYGISDEADTDRNIENIISEIHTAVHEIGLDKFYLMGHSLGGLYSLGYANKYPEDLLGVIGIDNTPSGFDEVKVNYSYVGPFFIFCNERHKSGYWKNAPEEEFILNVTPLDFTYNYTEEDLENFKIIFGYTYCNDNSLNEGLHFNSDIDELKGLHFPESIPVLQFVSSSNSYIYNYWKSAHEGLISNPNFPNEVILLRGSHYLYLDQKDAIVEKVESWINNF